MRKNIQFVFLLLIVNTTINCDAQKQGFKEITKNRSTKYILSTIYQNPYSLKELHNGSTFVSVYLMYDSKIKRKKNSEGTDEVLSSVLVSITTDGDYYTSSKLYKIEGILNPKVIEIKESKFPKFTITVESGSIGKRKNLLYEFTNNIGHP